MGRWVNGQKKAPLRGQDQAGLVYRAVSAARYATARQCHDNGFVLWWLLRQTSDPAAGCVGSKAPLDKDSGRVRFVSLRGNRLMTTGRQC